MEKQEASDSLGLESDILNRIKECVNKQQLERLHSMVCRRYHASERGEHIFLINQRYAELMDDCYWNEL